MLLYSTLYYLFVTEKLNYIRIYTDCPRRKYTALQVMLAVRYPLFQSAMNLEWRLLKNTL